MMENNNTKIRKKDSARLIWDSKPRRAPNPKDIEFQPAADFCHRDIREKEADYCRAGGGYIWQ